MRFFKIILFMVLLGAPLQLVIASYLPEVPGTFYVPLVPGPTGYIKGDGYPWVTYQPLLAS